MAETYSKILPGNFTVPLSAYALPNAAFTGPKGDPKNRHQQAVLVMPGILAVHKVGVAHITDGGGTDFDVIVPSPDTEQSPHKARADIQGLFVPTGAVLTRVGLRITGASEQPGYYSSGRRGVDPVFDKTTGLALPEDSGLVGTAGDALILATAGTATGAGAITATAAHTSDTTCKLGTDGRIFSHEESVNANPLLGGTATVTTADLTFKLFNTDAAGGPGTGIKSDILGGVYVIAEVVYLIADRVAGMGDGIKLSGGEYSGFGG